MVERKKFHKEPSRGTKLMLPKVEASPKVKPAACWTAWNSCLQGAQGGLCVSGQAAELAWWKLAAVRGDSAVLGGSACPSACLRAAAVWARVAGRLPILSVD